MSQSAVRTLKLLRLVALSTEPLGLMDAAEAAGLDKSTTARLLGGLVDTGFLVRDPDTRRYRVGPELIAIGSSSLRRADLQQVTAPRLVELRDATEETATLHVRVGDQRVCIGGVESRLDVRRVTPLGEQLGVHEGPTGKVMLAFLPSQEAAGILERSGTAQAGVAALLERVRRDGYMAAIGDRTPGIGAISAPVFDAAGVRGSISVAGPAERWGMERMTAFAPELLAVARDVSAAIGGRR